MLVTSPDGTKIAYDVHGNGPALLLLQGFDDVRNIWHSFGYVEKLCTTFQVITMDRRGIGESDMPTNSGAYTVEKMLADVFCVVDACSIDRFAIWGHSFGGTIALQLAARSNRIIRAVVAGSFFGRVYSEERVNSIVKELENVSAAQKIGKLAELGIEVEEQEYIAQMNIPALIACWQSLITWPVVSPKEICCPLLVYVGSLDERVVNPLKERQQEIAEAGIQLKTLDGLNHQQEVSDIQAVFPTSFAFLKH